MRRYVSLHERIKELTFSGSEEFIINVLALDPEGLQENFRVEPHENGGYFEYILLRRTIGSGSLHKIYGVDAVLWDKFYPLARLTEKHAERLKRKGIGTLAQIESCLCMVSLFGDYSNRLMISHDGVSGERGKQLERVGIKSNVRVFGITMDFAEIFPTYLQKWIDYANAKGFHFENPLKV